MVSQTDLSYREEQPEESLSRQLARAPRNQVLLELMNLVLECHQVHVLLQRKLLLDGHDRPGIEVGREYLDHSGWHTRAGRPGVGHLDELRQTEQTWSSPSTWHYTRA
jgi:hypothetical protein